MKSVGMPGPGGSMGQCCYCGLPFMAEIFGVGRVKEVSLSCAPDQTFYVHQKCLPKLQATEDIKDLPDESMIKIAWFKLQEDNAKAER